MVASADWNKHQIMFVETHLEMYLVLSLNAHQRRRLKFLLQFVYKFRRDQASSTCQLGRKLWIHIRLVRVYEGYTTLLYQGWVRANLAQAEEEHKNLMVIPRNYISGASKEGIREYSVLEHGSLPEIAIELGLTASLNHLVNFAFFFRKFQFNELDLFLW